MKIIELVKTPIIGSNTWSEG